VPVRDATAAPRGLRLHYRDWGDPSARPLVLLHGGWGNARQWDTVARAMGDRCRVLALDLRGHGESEHAPGGDYAPQVVVEDVAGFVDTLGLERFALVGFSIGGHAAYGYAAGHPGRVDRLVLVEAFIPPDTPENQALLGALRRLAELGFDDPEEAVGAFAAAGFAPRASEGERRHWVRTGLTQQADGRWAWRRDPVLRRPPAPDVQRFIPPPETMWRLLPRVACPTLIVRGVDTVAFALEEAERMAAAMPDARVASVPRAGHWPPLDNPTGFVALLRDFLAEG
jgi:pimeloyl-ACP methyl ester carboxylesterase